MQYNTICHPYFQPTMHQTLLLQFLVRAIAASLRMQSDPANKDFEGLSPERAYADYVLANMVLFLAAWNYIG